MKISARSSMFHREIPSNQSSTPLTATGFTLIELLISIAVLSILAGIGLPQLNGVYERQKLTNAANELVSQIKTLQNKALANDQDQFTVSEADGGPLTDCMPSPDNKAYVDGYKLTINADERGYESSYKLRSHNKAGVSCPTQSPPLTTSDKISTTLLPPGVHFGGGEAAKSITYNIVSGKITLSGDPDQTSEELTLSNERLPSTAVTYHVCINQGRVYVQTSACP